MGKAASAQTSMDEDLCDPGAEVAAGAQHTVFAGDLLAQNGVGGCGCTDTNFQSNKCYKDRPGNKITEQQDLYHVIALCLEFQPQNPLEVSAEEMALLHALEWLCSARKGGIAVRSGKFREAERLL